MRYAITLLLTLSACDSPATEPAPTCEEQVCSLVPDCSPLTTGTWDWRTEQACTDTFACGSTPDACLAAVEALPCLSHPPTWDEIEAHTRAMVAVREACGR